MPIATEKEHAHIGESRGAADHDHDMIHELSKRLDAVWRMDQYIVNAEGQRELEQFWRTLKSHELKNIQELKDMIAEHVRKDCF